MRMLSKRTLERLKKEQDALPAWMWEPMNKEHLTREYLIEHNTTVREVMDQIRAKFLVPNPDWVEPKKGERYRYK